MTATDETHPQRKTDSGTAFESFEFEKLVDLSSEELDLISRTETSELPTERLERLADRLSYLESDESEDCVPYEGFIMYRCHHCKRSCICDGTSERARSNQCLDCYRLPSLDYPDALGDPE